MKTVKQVPERAKDTKAVILSCAAELILKSGRKDFDINELAKLARIKRPTIYSHFDRAGQVRDSIFQDIVGQFLHEVHGRIALVLEAMDPAKLTPMKCIAAVFRVTLASFKRSELFGKVLLQHLNFAIRDENAQVFQIFERVDQLFGEARKAGQLDPEISKRLEDWKIRQIVFVTAHGLLRALYLNEGRQLTEPTKPSAKSSFSEREVEIEVLRVLQLYCSNKASSEIQATIDALDGGRYGTKEGKEK